MTDDPKTSTETLAESTCDTQSGRIRQAPDGTMESLPTSPRDAGTVPETPAGPTDRAETKAEEAGRRQGA